MGSGASILNPEPVSVMQITLKKLPDAIEEAVYVHEKFPLVIDPTEQASRFLKYQTGAFLNFEDPTQSTKNALNRALVASFLNGRAMTIKVPSLKVIQENVFEAGVFPKEAIDRMAFFEEPIWKACLRPKQGDPDPEDASITSEFALIIVTTKEEDIPALLWNKMYPIRVVEKLDEVPDTNGEVNSSGDAGMDQIASMFGASEIIRYVFRILTVLYTRSQSHFILEIVHN
jgi:hypothetical protein